ncbi:hypothetical protein F4823DRAFT_352169 [Ustulina deusta]|nr:hypothetical protein F4823DRAFT_352169 [Ustulina deusta]
MLNLGTFAEVNVNGIGRLLFALLLISSCSQTQYGGCSYRLIGLIRISVISNRNRSYRTRTRNKRGAHEPHSLSRAYQGDERQWGESRLSPVSSCRQTGCFHRPKPHHRPLVQLYGGVLSLDFQSNSSRLSTRLTDGLSNNAPLFYSSSHFLLA